MLAQACLIIASAICYRAVTQWFVVYSMLMFSANYCLDSRNNYSAFISILLLFCRELSLSVFNARPQMEPLANLSAHTKSLSHKG